jgi:5-methyltetrahydropteroyltriglutamate--homocysteine methyltransferase
VHELRGPNMAIPTEPIGSVPRPAELVAGLNDPDAVGDLVDRALADTIKRFEATGSPVITDGEQGKSSFVTYPIGPPTKYESDGAVIPFADGHTRQLPRLAAGPFQYAATSSQYLVKAKTLTSLPVKQAVIAPSALSLVYPADGIAGYPREKFLADLVDQAEADIRGSLDAGAHVVQIDFTEGRLSLKLDPSGGLLKDFVALINKVVDRFSDEEKQRLGLHTCPGGDQDSTHSLDVDYAGLLPDLFRVHVGNFYVQLASEADPDRVLRIIAEHLPANARVFVGVTDPIDPRVETAEEVRDRVLKAAEHIPVDQLGTCDDCGFSPFSDDVSTSRDTAFAKIAARVEGTKLASEALGV